MAAVHVSSLTGVGWVDFMPADDQMVGTRTVDGRTVLSMIDVTGGAIRDLDVGDIELRGWVMPRPPDGQEIVFTGRPHPGKKDLGIYGIKPDGTGLRTIGAISTTESGDGGVPPTNQISFQDPVHLPRWQDHRVLELGTQPGGIRRAAAHTCTCGT